MGAQALELFRQTYHAHRVCSHPCVYICIFPGVKHTTQTTTPLRRISTRTPLKASCSIVRLKQVIEREIHQYCQRHFPRLPSVRHNRTPVRQKKKKGGWLASSLERLCTSHINISTRRASATESNANVCSSQLSSSEP